MKKHAFAAAIAVAFTAAPALAQTDPVAGTMTGPRVEATVGWDHVVLSLDGNSGTKSGVTYGGEIGYDIQLGTGGVVGAYAGIDDSSTRQCISGGTERACIGAGRNFTIGARVGAVLGTRSLIYGKGGYSNGRIDVRYTDSAFPADNFRDRADLDGFHLGAGVEVGLPRGFYGKAEYNYTNYRTGNDEFSTDLERHRVVGGVGYRF